MIHCGELPAILVSERIYRIPGASFERYKAGGLRTPGVAPEGGRGRYYGLPISGFEAVRQFASLWGQARPLGCVGLRCME